MEESLHNSYIYLKAPGRNPKLHTKLLQAGGGSVDKGTLTVSKSLHSV